MKKLFFIAAIMSIAFMGCTVESETAIVDLDAEKAAVEAVLEQYIVANMEQDFNLIVQIWEPDERVILIGTESHERLVGWDNIEKAYKNQYGAYSETFIVVSDQMIRVDKSGTIAWFSESLKYNFIYNEKARSFSDIRFTGVLEKLNGKWLLVQGHLSVPTELEKKEVY